MPKKGKKKTHKKRIEKIPVGQIRLDPYGEQLAQKYMKPYIDFMTAKLKGNEKEIDAALERIKALPMDKRYLFRILEALNWGFADFDASSVLLDLKTLPKDELEKLMVNGNLEFRVKQFCIFLCCLVGAENMEKIMTNAVSIARIPFQQRPGR